MHGVDDFVSMDDVLSCIEREKEEVIEMWDPEATK